VSQALANHPIAFRASRGAALAAIVAMVLAATVHAEEGGDADERYREAIAQAITAFDASDFVAARSAFERAHELSPNARTFRGIGVTAFRQGEFVAASAALRAALNDTRKPLTSAQSAEVTELLAQAKERIGHVTVVAVPARAIVQMDGRTVASNRELEVQSGAHFFRGELGGYVSIERQTEVPPGVRTTVTLELPVAPGGSDGAARSRDKPAPLPDSGAAATPNPAKGRFWTWMALGAAPVFAGAGLAVWLSGLSDAERIKNCTTCDKDSEAQKAGLPTKAAWTTALEIAAGAAAGTAIVLYFVESPSGEKSGRGLTLGLHGSFAYARGTF
jgi:hypothetical protein